jgi:hypothetical protein
LKGTKVSTRNSELLWQNKVGNPAQIGGIETSVLDNGPGKGARIAWVNTGASLRYKVVIDRGLDIVDAFYNQHSLAWLSHLGVTTARPDANHDLEWLYTFAGGLMTTCGLTHIGVPENDNTGQRGLHGRISNIPAFVESIVQPDLASADSEMSITAVVKQARVFGPNLELRRTISSRLGQAAIKIHDVVTNRGNNKAPHMMLYHCNYGWPLVDEGTEFVWKGNWKSFGRDMDKEIFNNNNDFKKCREPMDNHRGAGESCGIIDVDCDSNGLCNVGLYNRKLGIAVVMKYKKQQLPKLTNWQHWGPGEYVTALEPGTNAPIGQSKAKELNELIYLKGDESRTYDLEIAVLTDQRQIEQFIKTAG